MNAYTEPDSTGHFGRFGGRFMPEALVGPLDELAAAWTEAKADPAFMAGLDAMLTEYAHVLRSDLGSARPFAQLRFDQLDRKRIELNRLAAGDDRRQHPVKLRAEQQQMGMRRWFLQRFQHRVLALLVERLGRLDHENPVTGPRTPQGCLPDHPLPDITDRVSVKTGSRTLKDAINEALRDWVSSVDSTSYLFGTAAGPHPFPAMVRDLTRGIGDEAREQCIRLTGELPDAAVACVGGGSNAIGLFSAFIPDESVRLYGIEAGGDGFETGRHAATISAGEVGVLHGARSYLLQNEDGQTIDSHSISAGLDYPGVGPEHAFLSESGRAKYFPATDAEAMSAFDLLCKSEGIIPAIESAHALAGSLTVAKELGPDATILVNLSGRGDKDVHTAAKYFGLLSDGSKGQP